MVILTSDHGEAFWEYGQAGHGKSLHEEVLRVPLILHGANDRLAGNTLAYIIFFQSKTFGFLPEW